MRWKIFYFWESKYKVSDTGLVYSYRSKRNIGSKIVVQCANHTYARNIVSLGSKGTQKSFYIDKLVLWAFKQQPENKDNALHLDCDLSNDISKNLKWSTRGDIKRYYFRKRKQTRGIYKIDPKVWHKGKKMYAKNPKRYRVCFKVDKKTVTFGYAYTYKEAKKLYIKSYEQVYGANPYAV